MTDEQKMSTPNPFLTVERKTVDTIVRYLAEQARIRFDSHGPKDARGAAFWDAARAIDPNDHDVLGYKASR